MSNPHDSHGAGDSQVEDIIPVGSAQDKALGIVALIALLGLVFWGMDMSQPIALEASAQHRASSGHSKESGSFAPDAGAEHHSEAHPAEH